MADPGFAIVEGVLPAMEVHAIAEHVERADVARTRAGARNVLAVPAVARLARDERLESIASGVLGAPAFAFKATLFDKSPRSNWLVTWHQDTALPVRERRDAPGWSAWSRKAGVLHAHAPASVLERIVAIRVHLDDSTAANGPLRVLPGTHGFGVLADARIDECARAVPAVECTVGAGGLVVMRPLLVHSSSKATDGRPRRVLHLEFASERDLGHGVELCGGAA